MPKGVAVISLIVGFLVLAGAVTVIVNQSFGSDGAEQPSDDGQNGGQDPATVPTGHRAGNHVHEAPTVQVADLEWNLSAGPASLVGTVLHDHPDEVVVQITAKAANGSWQTPLIVNASGNGGWNWTVPYDLAGVWTIQVLAEHPPESTSSPAALIELNLTGSPPVTEPSGEDGEDGSGGDGGQGGSGNGSTPLSGQCLDSHSNLAQHIHPTLRIFSDGDQVAIPADIGIDTWACPSAMHLVHTHDFTGRLHVESHEPIELPLGTFFEIWGEVFNSTQVLDLKADANHTLSMTVDGVDVDTWQHTVLADGQVIVIDHQTAPMAGGGNGSNGTGGGDGENGSNGTVDPPDGGNNTNQTTYDSSDLAQFWLDFFFCQDGDSPPIDDYNTTAFDGHVCDVSVTTNSTHVIITSNGLPEHDLESGPGCCASAQDLTWSLPRAPINDTTGGHDSSDCPSAAGAYECAGERGPVAVAVNGVPFFGPEDGPGGDAVASHHGEYEEDRQQIWLGVCHGHSGPGGMYHYHADANCVHWHPDSDAGGVMLDYDMLNTTYDGNHSKPIGAAFDGYPIYGVWGEAENGSIVEMRSSYRLKAGETGYNGIDDYEFIPGLGDLDVCNGHFSATPEFPDGIYHYHSTLNNGDGDMGFPYFLICYHGEADMSNSEGGDGGPDCSGFGETWGPGIGPPPPGCEGGPGGGGGQTNSMSRGVTPLSAVVASSMSLSAIMLGALLGVLAHVATERSRRGLRR